MSQRLDELWEDSANWKLGAIYVCQEDPRIVVRKRFGVGYGWTLNFGHRLSIPALVLVMVLCAGPFLLLARNSPTMMRSMQALALSLMLTIGLFFLLGRVGRE